jgi:hypothetical protein
MTYATTGIDIQRTSQNQSFRYLMPLKDNGTGIGFLANAELLQVGQSHDI